MKVYHFCAMSQRDDMASLNYIDGVISSNAKLSNPDEYAELKKLIGEKMNPARTDLSRIALLSLTVIGEA
jgi:hypothetical protein